LGWVLLGKMALNDFLILFLLVSDDAAVRVCPPWVPRASCLSGLSIRPEV
jgi:hypothetical protein